MRKVFTVAMIATAALGLAACSEKTDDNAAMTADSMGNDMDNTGDAMMNGADEMGNSMSNGADAMGDSMSNDGMTDDGMAMNESAPQ